MKGKNNKFLIAYVFFVLLCVFCGITVSVFFYQQ
jgi:hypothetical protein